MRRDQHWRTHPVSYKVERTRIHHNGGLVPEQGAQGFGFFEGATFWVRSRSDEPGIDAPVRLSALDEGLGSLCENECSRGGRTPCNRHVVLPRIVAEGAEPGAPGSLGVQERCAGEGTRTGHLPERAARVFVVVGVRGCDPVRWTHGVPSGRPSDVRYSRTPRSSAASFCVASRCRSLAVP